MTEKELIKKVFEENYKSTALEKSSAEILQGSLSRGAAVKKSFIMPLVTAAAIGVVVLGGAFVLTDIKKPETVKNDFLVSKSSTVTSAEPNSRITTNSDYAVTTSTASVTDESEGLTETAASESTQTQEAVKTVTSASSAQTVTSWTQYTADTPTSQYADNGGYSGGDDENEDDSSYAEVKTTSQQEPVSEKTSEKTTAAEKKTSQTTTKKKTETTTQKQTTSAATTTSTAAPTTTEKPSTTPRKETTSVTTTTEVQEDDDAIPAYMTDFETIDTDKTHNFTNIYLTSKITWDYDDEENGKYKMGDVVSENTVEITDEDEKNGIINWYLNLQKNDFYGCFTRPWDFSCEWQALVIWDTRQYDNRYLTLYYTDENDELHKIILQWYYDEGVYITTDKGKLFYSKTYYIEDDYPGKPIPELDGVWFSHGF